MPQTRRSQRFYRPGRFVRLKDLKEFFEVWDTTIYRWIKKRGFPKPYKPGPNTSLWDMDEIEEWILSCRQKEKIDKEISCR